MKGVSELLLCGAILAAAWTRTPAGALLDKAVSAARGVDGPDLMARYRTALPTDLSDSLHHALNSGPSDLPDNAHASWSPALRTAVEAHLGAAHWASLDHSAPPEEALERAAIGDEARARAISRATSAGEANPEHYSAHRRYLPDELSRTADAKVADVLSLSTALDLTWPVDTRTRVSSGFGPRTHPVLGTTRMHEGVDIALPIGTPIHAAGSGRVSRSREDAVNGRHIILSHGHGVTTAYCHADGLEVEKGDRVRQGDHIADSGNTGRSTGPHLHFGLRIDGHPVDPAPFRRGAAES